MTTQNNEYADSSEFTAEFYELLAHVRKAKVIMTSPKFVHWLNVTDRNHDTECFKIYVNALVRVVPLKYQLEALEQELDKAV